MAATYTLLELRGSTTMRWMPLVFSNPMRCQVRPPSKLRNRPSPMLWELRGLPSPVPTQITSGLDGSTFTAPMDAFGWSSQMEFQLCPALLLFQSPPEAEPT